MKPKATVHPAQRELFRIELEGLVGAGHALVKLGRQMNWASFDEQLGQTYDPSNGAPGVSTRLRVALHYLKYRYDLSDDVVLAQWVENPYWQHFSEVNLPASTQRASSSDAGSFSVTLPDGLVIRWIDEAAVAMQLQPLSADQVKPKVLFGQVLSELMVNLSVLTPLVAAIEDTLACKTGVKIDRGGWKRHPIGPAVQTNRVRRQR